MPLAASSKRRSQFSQPLVRMPPGYRHHQMRARDVDGFTLGFGLFGPL
jgi:hypothetical protein